MAWAVHGFHGPFLTLDIETKHSILVMHGMAGPVPQIQVVNVGCDDLIIATFPIVSANEFDQLVVDTSAMWKPKSTSCGQIVEHDQILFGGYATVIALFRLSAQ
jgi:hypothetical protein